MAGTTVNTSPETSPGGCASQYGVWYTFTGDGCPTTISSTSSGGWDHEMDIFSGSCGSLTNITCQDAALSNGTESYTFTTVNGTTYYVYIAHYSTSSTTTGTFTISRSCVAPCSGIPNAGTVSASVNPVTCASPSTTLTGNGLSADCGISYQWQSSPTGAAPWTNIAGATNTTVTVSPTSNTYYRIVTTCSYSGSSNNSSSLLINSSITSPSNDDCANAVTLTVNPDESCAIVTSGTTVCATIPEFLLVLVVVLMMMFGINL